jgi:hypothetical protein
MKQELEITLIEQIKRTFTEANDLAKAASDKGREAIMKARECGQYLIEAKQAVGHGKWLEWLANSSHGWNLDHETARRWMKLALIPIEQLDQALSLRQAYIAAGIIPEAQGNTGKVAASSGGDSWLNAILGVTERINKLREASPVDEWPETQRMTMKEKLRPLVEFYEAL